LWVRSDGLNSNTKGCGCVSKERAIDISGQRFGNLKAIEKTDERDKNNGSVIWRCECDCGNEKKVSIRQLKKESVRSCGCLSKSASINNLKKAMKINFEVNLVEGTSLSIISNIKPKSNNTSGIPGVTWVKNRGTWSARITFKGKTYNLGNYKDKDKAIQVRKIAENKIFGEFLDWYYNEKNTNK